MNPEFIGTGWKFPPQFNQYHRQVEMSSSDENIQQSLHILLSTKPGERVMQPSYGCHLQSFIFDSLDLGILTQVKESVRKSILLFEPRITVVNIEVQPERSWINIMIDYVIRATNTRSNKVYPYYYKEGTNIHD
ncbi:GPW/gp25 family protein [Zooshikella sp. RANM57]|uniref:GPW/gp25 family protein n=1 Tax=Zooshikella sp. RANM57 TaxID=3425863 RepID=UPI003D6DD510